MPTPPHTASPPKATAASGHVVEAVAGCEDGHEVTCRALHRLGVRFMFGVVGIPVTPLASAAQACGIRFIGFRNEQAAGYAAAAVGFLTGTPAALLTVSGPGAVHGIAGLSHAMANCWPLIQVSERLSPHRLTSPIYLTSLDHTHHHFCLGWDPGACSHLSSLSPHTPGQRQLRGA